MTWWENWWVLGRTRGEYIKDEIDNNFGWVVGGDMRVNFYPWKGSHDYYYYFFCLF